MAGEDFNDWLAITTLKARYRRLLYTKDWNGFATLFTPDYVMDASASGGPCTARREAAIASVRGSIEAATTAHHVHAPEITIAGDAAHGIWAMQDRLVQPDGQTLRGYGHYHEDYVRTGSGWTIGVSRLTRLGIEMLSPGA